MGTIPKENNYCWIYFQPSSNPALEKLLNNELRHRHFHEIFQNFQNIADTPDFTENISCLLPKMNEYFNSLLLLCSNFITVTTKVNMTQKNNTAISFYYENKHLQV